jgi:hypothetical protein
MPSFNLDEEKTNPRTGLFATTTFLTRIFIDFQKDTLTIPKRMVFSDDILKRPFASGCIGR